MSALVKVDPRSAAARRLFTLSNELMYALYPPEICFLDSPEELIEADAWVLGVEDQGELVAVGAAKIIDGYGELKRVFVLPEHRGKGYARRIIFSLESLLEVNVPVVRLETGTLQPESISLYRSMGYSERGPYGDYTDNGYSVFMEKQI